MRSIVYPTGLLRYATSVINPALQPARHFRLQCNFNIDMSMRLQLVRTRQFRNRPVPFICALTNARPVATAVAAVERSIDSCNAKQSNEPCCALYDRLDTSLYTICCTVHVVSERVFRCNVSCNTIAIVITLFCFFFAFNAFFARVLSFALENYFHSDVTNCKSSLF